MVLLGHLTAAVNCSFREAQQLEHSCRDWEELPNILLAKEKQNCDCIEAHSYLNH